jgi:antitoxin StbD
VADWHARSAIRRKLYRYLHKFGLVGTITGMARSTAAVGEVLPTSEARAHLTQITAELRTRGAAAGLVVFGSHRRPEAAVIPYELVELLDPVIEDLVTAARIRERLGADDGSRFDAADVAAELGLDYPAR